MQSRLTVLCMLIIVRQYTLSNRQFPCWLLALHWLFKLLFCQFRVADMILHHCVEFQDNLVQWFLNFLSGDPTKKTDEVWQPHVCPKPLVIALGRLDLSNL